VRVKSSLVVRVVLSPADLSATSLPGAAVGVEIGRIVARGHCRERGPIARKSLESSYNEWLGRLWKTFEIVVIPRHSNSSGEYSYTSCTKRSLRR
jgi:hypothetical protein